MRSLDEQREVAIRRRRLSTARTNAYTSRRMLEEAAIAWVVAALSGGPTDGWDRVKDRYAVWRQRAEVLDQLEREQIEYGRAHAMPGTDPGCCIAKLGDAPAPGCCVGK